ncbi:hypothetical protein F4803DRAFT_219676 [Xylaria telfairii]|nr:hypothetical protein F4803DRAFT_219676 [Xylaria telfairii]
MHVPTLALALASLSFLAESAPVNEPSGLVILQQFTSKDGVSTITVYGDAVESHSEVTAVRSINLHPRCGSKSLVCDNQHLANRNACNNLVNDLRGSFQDIPNSPRSICGNYSGAQCCVSWHTPVQSAIRDNLVAAAQKVLDGCQGDTGVSGETTDTQLGSSCTTQCLSNRATGC